ncbi:MAG: hypothetical protein ABI171_05795 [Collimonas sp.]|uniref:hypothetical protein n=1 Tax=Collimonas sp. TaxID=1963772 RepID=UPI00326569CE
MDQGKTKKLRTSITGELTTVLGRIVVRKAQHKIENDQLLMNGDDKVFRLPALRGHFDRAKAADDTSDDRGDHAASDQPDYFNFATAS